MDHSKPLKFDFNLPFKVCLGSQTYPVQGKMALYSSLCLNIDFTLTS